MRPLRIEQDPEHGKSRQRLEESGLLKKNCEQTRKALPEYLCGHVFWITRIRIEQHLEHCVVCKSEFDSLRHAEETCLLLSDIDAPEGVVHRVRKGIASLAKLKKILYRPLWLASIALAVAGISYYASQPRQLDLEIERIVQSSPVATSPAPSPARQPKAPVVTPPVAKVPQPVPQPVSTPVVAPLAVSITPVNETTAIGQINEVMSGHEQLRKLKFSETNRVLSGDLTAQEIAVFFDRIGGVARVRYDRKRLASFPADGQIPFVLTLKAAPKTVEHPATAVKPVTSTVTETPAPAQKPVTSTDSKPPAPAETTASAPSATAPAPPAAE